MDKRVKLKGQTKALNKKMAKTLALDVLGKKGGRRIEAKYQCLK